MCADISTDDILRICALTSGIKARAVMVSVGTMECPGPSEHNRPGAEPQTRGNGQPITLFCFVEELLR